MQHFDQNKDLNDLHAVGDEVEIAVLQDNIYKAAVFDKLLAYEKRVNDIRKKTGLKVEEVLQASVVRSPLEILNSALLFWDEKLLEMGIQSDAELALLLQSKFKIKVKRSDAIYVPPDHQEIHEMKNIKHVEKSEVDYNRVALALKTILHLTIAGENILLDDLDVTISELPEDSFRERAYWAINIKKHKILVLVNNQYANRTFVAGYDSENNYQSLVNSSKSGLKRRANIRQLVRHFRFDSPDQFADDLAKNIMAIYDKELMVQMDAAYFTAENVAKDLASFAASFNVAPEDLNLGNDHCRSYAFCSNGEEVQFQTYLLRAGKVFGHGKSSNELMAAKKKTLFVLGQMAGLTLRLKEPLVKEVVEDKKEHPKMDAMYFTAENVHKDLEAFAEQENVKIGELNIGNMQKNTAICANGEKVAARSYLNRAGVALGLNQSTREGDFTHRQILDHLKSMMGGVVEEKKTYSKMDAAYFTVENVRKDLKAFAVVVGVDAADLNLGRKMLDHKFLCANGEMVAGRVYMARAANVLCEAAGNEESADVSESKSLKPVFGILKRMMGVEVLDEMDSAYFTAEHVRKDLESFAEAAKLPLNALTVGGLSNYKVRCVNGEELSGEAYIRRAGVGLKLAKNTKEALPILKQILADLKKLIGVEVFDEMNTEYFTKDNVQRDLNAFAEEAKCSVAEFKGRKVFDTRVKCVSKEEVLGLTYVCRAAVALGFEKTFEDAARNIKQNLIRLKRFSGLEIKEYDQIDADYYTKENVGNDLKSFAKAAKVEVKNLTAGGILKIEIECASGEVIKGAKYLYKAARIIGSAKSVKEANSMRSRILDELKRKIGLTVEEKKEYPEMNSEYFSAENVKKDLNAYAKALSVPVSDLNASKIKELQVECCNGEKVLGLTYIRRAGKALFYAENDAQASAMGAQIFLKLKEAAVDMGEVHFSFLGKTDPA